MKKIMYVFAACAVMALASCGSKSEKPAEPATTDNTEAVAPADDVEIDEAAASIAGAYEGVAEEIEKVQSKDDLKAICIALGETLKELDAKYPNYQPDAETAKAIQEASLTVGEAIGTVGKTLEMSEDEINECMQYITFE